MKKRRHSIAEEKPKDFLNGLRKTILKNPKTIFKRRFSVSDPDKDMGEKLHKKIQRLKETCRDRYKKLAPRNTPHANK